MDRFDAMQAFIRVVELKSFTKAAASLNLPKTTVSAQVQALESRLQIKLLHRTTRQISLTTDGAAYYDRAVRLLQDLEETESLLGKSAATPKGRLRIDIPGSFGRLIILPALQDFMQRYPEIELEIGCNDRRVDLLEEGVDCVIRGGALTDLSLVARRVASVRFVTCASPDYLKRHGTPVDPTDIAHHISIHYFSSSLAGKVFGHTYEKDGIKTEIRGHRKLLLNDGESCLIAARAGLGIAQVPTYLAQDYIASGELMVVLGTYLSEDLPIHVLYPQNRHLSTKVRVFIDWIAALFDSSDLIQGRSLIRAPQT